MFRFFEGVAAIPSNNERTAASNDAVDKSIGLVPNRRGTGNVLVLIIVRFGVD